MFCPLLGAGMGAGGNVDPLCVGGPLACSSLFFIYINTEKHVLSSGSLSTQESSGSSKRPTGIFGFLSGCLVDSAFPFVLKSALPKELHSKAAPIAYKDRLFKKIFKECLHYQYISKQKIIKKWNLRLGHYHLIFRLRF